MDDIFEAIRAFNNGEEGYFYNRELMRKDREDLTLEKGIQKGEKSGIKKGIKKGIKDRNIEIVKNMLALNLKKEIIMQATGLTTKEIDKIIKQN